MVAQRKRDLPRVDTQKVRDGFDCRHVVESLLHQKPRTGGVDSADAWTFRCPFHQEQHGASFVVWEDGWACYGACGNAGDVIQFVMNLNNLRFFEAVKWLQGDNLPLQAEGYVRVERPKRDFQMPPEVWQEAAAKFVSWSQERLAHNQPMMRYLTEKRMLTLQTIRMARLGASPGQYIGWTKQFGLLHQRGITIPWAVGKNYSAINVRRMLPERSDENKYRQVQGSQKGLYGYNSVVHDGRPLVFTEGEFDCLLLQQFIGDRASVVTIGGSNDKFFSAFGDVNDGRRWIHVYDADAAGLNQLAYLQTINPSTVGHPVPVGKDVTEFVRSLPGIFEEVAVNVRRWFQEVA